MVGAWAAGMRQREDAEHLAYATAQNRVLYGFNVGDFYRLHTELLAQNKSHAGIVLAKQQHCSVGEQMRQLIKLIATKSAEEMRAKIEFLSSWV